VSRAARCATCVALSLAVPGGSPEAQQGTLPPAGSAADCPVVGGVRVAVTARDTGRAPAAPRELARIDRRTAVDTTFTFDVAERRWVLAELAASVAAGLADTARGRWYLCAGGAVGLRRPTLVVRGARGQIRLRASVDALSRALGPGQTESGRQRTPPRRS
jgi:hypothetical protein